MTVPRALLAEIVDYAGLFPPAALHMRTAVTNFAAYQAGPDAWMLGRFVVPVSRLDEMRNACDGAHVLPGAPMRVSALLGADAIADIERVRRFADANRDRVAVDCLEAKLASPESIKTAAGAARGFQLFAEVPVADDPRTLIMAVADAGVNAKIRTGGVTPEAFPSAASVLRFIRRAVDAGVAFKATAGLHHPLCAEYRLTYDEGAACGSMFGFLNVFLAAAAVSAGADDDDAASILNERRADRFRCRAEAVSWGRFVFSANELDRVRRQVAVSFGSCSFTEPVDESRALGLIA